MLQCAEVRLYKSPFVFVLERRVTFHSFRDELCSLLTPVTLCQCGSRLNQCMLGSPKVYFKPCCSVNGSRLYVDTLEAEQSNRRNIKSTVGSIDTFKHIHTHQWEKGERVKQFGYLSQYSFW